MNTDRAGIRGARPLRRRTSISSPRIAPFSPFTPSLTYRSPIIRSPSSPTLQPFYFPTNEQPSSRDTSGLRRVFSPRTLKSASCPRSRSRKLAVASFGCLILTALCWRFLALHSTTTILPGAQSSGKLFRNDTLPYYHRYLIPKANNIAFALTPEDQSDILPLPLPHAQLVPLEAAYSSASFPSLSLVLPCPPHNLTSILPRTLYSLRSRLLSFSPPQPIVLVCSPSQLREAIRIADNSGQPEIYVRMTSYEPPQQNERHRKHNADIDVIHVAASLPTEWAVILDSEGLINIPLSVITLLHHPPKSLVVPFGPRGVVFSRYGASCILNRSPGEAPVPAAFLVPPFVCRTRILYEAEAGLDVRPGLSAWAALGLRIALRAAQVDQSRLYSSNQATVGGFVVGVDHPSHQENWCPSVLDDETSDTAKRDRDSSYLDHTTLPLIKSVSAYVYSVLHNAHFGFSTSGTIAVLLPDISALLAFLPMLCRSARLGHNLRILIYNKQPTRFTDVLNGCHMHYDTLLPGSNSHESLWDWLAECAAASDVIIAVSRDHIAKMEIGLAILNLEELRPPPLSENVVIWLPPDELPYLEWAGALSIEEWRRWHTPRVDLVIITNDRPASLARLVRSVQSALYFGDSVSLIVNTEQTADLWTQAQIQGLVWNQGSLVVRHRVLLGGLLPAVVESWFPSSNDSYGLLLEDDVEVSPMFYAWIKLCLLRYRYGSQAGNSEKLFGISLYQQKSIELRPQGRESFYAASLFESAGLPHLHTPFLSQIPCSWGGLYFPDYWRMFHAYLIDRLAERTHAIEASIIAPSSCIRSNRWTRSWKKFFNEFVFLHGLVMLYPNFANWTALSTNHLEVGVHVRRTELEGGFEKKKAQFHLPLMALPPHPLVQTKLKRSMQGNDNGSQWGLGSMLDLPFETLPRWDALPVVDLWGHLTSEEEITRRGVERYKELVANCSDDVGQRPLCKVSDDDKMEDDGADFGQ